ncbi:MAG: hypothetical protein HC890_08885, partial [Chloroflexaceae bacterium]|nr:hypothetical protein [Chloroflexaceae bacterium]
MLPAVALSTMTEDRQLTLAPADYGLLTDLYQLTMAACYIGEGITDCPACFELLCAACRQDFLRRIGHETLAPVTAVVGADHDVAEALE